MKHLLIKMSSPDDSSSAHHERTERLRCELSNSNTQSDSDQLSTLVSLSSSLFGEKKMEESWTYITQAKSLVDQRPAELFKPEELSLMYYQLGTMELLYKKTNSKALSTLTKGARLLEPLTHPLSTNTMHKTILIRIYYYMAMSHYRLGNFETAHQLFEKILEMAPNEADRLKFTKDFEAFRRYTGR